MILLVNKQVELVISLLGFFHLPPDRGFNPKGGGVLLWYWGLNPPFRKFSDRDHGFFRVSDPLVTRLDVGS